MNGLIKYLPTRGSYLHTHSKNGGRVFPSRPVVPPTSAKGGVGGVGAALLRADWTHLAVETVTPWPLPKVSPEIKEDTSYS